MNTVGSRLLTVGLLLLAVLLGAAAALGVQVGLVGVVVALAVALFAMLGSYRFGLMALGGAFFTAPMYRGIGAAGPITPTDAFMFIGLVLLCPIVLRRRLAVPAMLVWPSILLVVLGFVASVLANPAPVASIIYVVQWLLVFTVLPAFLRVWDPSRRIIDGLLWCYIAGQLLSTLKALAGGAALNGRYQGFASHANDFGLAGAVAVVAVICLLPQAKGLRARCFLLGIGVASAYSIVMSGSRGSTLALAVVVAFVPIVERSGVWAVLWTAAGALGLALLPFLIQFGGAGGSLSRLAGDATASASDSQRTDALTQGWQRFLHSPFLGSGIDPLVGEYHNLFLEVAVAVGIFGVAAYVVLCWYFARPLFTAHPMRRLAYMPWLFLVCGISFPGLVDRTILVPMSLAILATAPIVKIDDVGGETAPSTSLAVAS